MVHFFLLSFRQNALFTSTPVWVRDPLQLEKCLGGGGDNGNFWLSFPCAAMLSAHDMKFQEAWCLSEQYLPFSKETERFIITVRQ